MIGKKRKLNFTAFNKTRNNVENQYSAHTRITRAGDIRVTRAGDTRVTRATGYLFVLTAGRRNFTFTGFTQR